MWFDVTDRLDGCSEFKEKVFKIFQKDRLSRMKEDSFRKISKYIKDYVIDNEAIYIEGLVGPIIKSERSVTTKKRDVIGEILFVYKSFEDNDMIRLKDV